MFTFLQDISLSFETKLHVRKKMKLVEWKRRLKKKRFSSRNSTRNECKRTRMQISSLGERSSTRKQRASIFLFSSSFALSGCSVCDERRGWKEGKKQEPANYTHCNEIKVYFQCALLPSPLHPFSSRNTIVQRAPVRFRFPKREATAPREREREKDSFH